MLRDKAEVLQEVEALLDSAAAGVGNLRYELSHYPMQDLAEVFEFLPDDRQLILLSNIDSPENAAELVAELDPQVQRELIIRLDPEHLKAIAREMHLDDLVDMLENAPQEMHANLVDAIESEDRAALQELKQYPPDSAGGLMNTDILAVTLGTPAKEVFNRIRDEHYIETVYYIYAVDDTGKLAGVLSLRDLLMLKPDEPVDKIMQRDPISIQVTDDQEEAAWVVEKYNYHAMPVVDADGTLKGIITHDDIVDVIQDEASEDMMIMAGAGSDAALLHGSVWKHCGARIPWLFLTTLGGMVSAGVMASFQTTMKNSLAVSFFVPMIMAIGGATGNQSSTIMVRSIAMGHTEGRSIFWALRQELIGSFFIGLSCSAFVIAAMFGIHHLGLLETETQLPFIIAISMFIGIQVATTVGTLFPLYCDKLSIDPALAAGPFIASLNDIIGLIIYMTVSTLLLAAIA